MAKQYLTPSCPYGYTQDDLLRLFGVAGIDDFNKWMRGQTQSICDGTRYNHDKKECEPTMCKDHPHGLITYTWDAERYIDKLPIVD